MMSDWWRDQDQDDSWIQTATRRTATARRK
jgi:hypothetical protein